MTFVLNYLYVAVFIVGLLLSWRAYKKGNHTWAKRFAIGALVLATLAFLATPYIPVHQGKRVLPLDTPMVDAPLEPIEVSNRLLVPRHTPEQSEARAKEVFDWKAKVAENKPTKPAPKEADKE